MPPDDPIRPQRPNPTEPTTKAAFIALSDPIGVRLDTALAIGEQLKVLLRVSQAPLEPNIAADMRAATQELIVLQMRLVNEALQLIAETARRKEG